MGHAFGYSPHVSFILVTTIDGLEGKSREGSPLDANGGGLRQAEGFAVASTTNCSDTRKKMALAESACEKQLPREYKEFLGFADGWSGFFVTTDLAGTVELINGRPNIVLRRPALPELIQDVGASEKHSIIIGASELDLDAFLLSSPYSPVLPGGVIRFASEEVQRYSSFNDFVSSMAKYNVRTAKKSAAKHGASRPN